MELVAYYYVIPMLINLAIVRVMIHRKEFKPGFEKTLVVFAPLVNLVAAVVLCIGFLLNFLVWASNGTTDVE